MSKRVRNRELNKGISIILTAALLLSIGAFLPPITAYADMLPEDESFSSTFDMRADFDTSNAVFLNSPVENGRMWTDKSVNLDTAFIYDTAGKPIDSVTAEADEFLVTFSALSQSFTVDAIVEPSDTVFVIDVSSSMYMNTVSDTGRSRIAELVVALNIAIKALMDANPNNRVAVVAYGGHSGESRVYPILRLGHYNISSGIYFILSGSTKLTVSTQIPDTALFNTAFRTVSVEGGTPTQRGIYAGAKVLFENTDTIFTAVVDGKLFEVIRRPNIILMTDGSPTMGWTDYRFGNADSDTDNGFDVGNASNSDMGLSVLTVMTAAYMKQRVHEQYYGSDLTRDVGFYTIGLGLDSNIVRATMNPYGATPDRRVNADLVSQSLSGVSYNMRVLLDRFAAGESVTFPALNRGSASARSLRTVDNPSRFVVTADFADLSFSAMSAAELESAFSQIAQRIVSRGSYSTLVDPEAADFDGYLVFSDVLGEYMQIRDVKGLWFENIRYDGHLFARDIQNNAAGVQDQFINVMMEHQSDAETGGTMTEVQARNLLASNLIAGEANGGLYFKSNTDFSNRIKYYTDAKRSFVGSFFNTDGTPADVPSTAMAVVELYTMRGNAVNPVTGELTDLMNIAFHVVTALKDGEFECIFSDNTFLVRDLQAGDQVARWYIPASLIPLRTVTSVIDADGILTGDVQIIEGVPIRFVYSVGLDVERVLAGLSDDYMKENPAQGADGYYFYSNRWRDSDNRTMAFFQPSRDNPYYMTPDTDRDPIMKADYLNHPSSTLNYILWDREFVGGDGNSVHIQELGNNGRLTMPVTEMIVIKTWSLPTGVDDFNDVDWIKPEYVQLFGSGMPVGVPVLLDPDNGVYPPPNSPVVMYTWADIPLLDLRPDVDGNVSRMEYVALEGIVDDGVFLAYAPFGNGGDPSPIFNIDYFRSSMNIAGDVVEYEQINNFERRTDNQRILILEKNVAGLPAEIAADLEIEFEVLALDTSVSPPSFVELDGNPVIFPDNFSNGRAIFDIASPLYSFKIVENYQEVPGYTWSLSGFVMLPPPYADLAIPVGSTATLPNGATIGLVENAPNWELHIDNVPDHEILTFSLTNTYTLADPPALTLTKAFDGALGWADIHDIVFQVDGWSDAERVSRIYSRTIPLSDLAASIGAANERGVTLTDAPPGYYIISELGAENSVNATNPSNPNDHEHSFYVDTEFTIIDENGILVPLTPTSDGNRFWLGQGDDITAAVTNTYTRLPELVLGKAFTFQATDGTTGIDADFMPNDILFRITGPNGFRDVIPYGMFIGDEYRVSGLLPGEYTITETGGLVPGYDGPFLYADIAGNLSPVPESGYTFTIGAAGMPDTDLRIVNMYTQMLNPPPASLMVVKLFYGTVPSPLPDNIKFRVTGSAFDEVFSFRDDFDASGQLFIDGLEPGIYTVAEIGGETDGFTRSINHADGRFTTSPILFGQQGEVIFVNEYESENPSVFDLILIKTFKGLTQEEIADVSMISFLITGPDNFRQTVFFDDFIYEKEYDRYVLVVSNLQTGSYIISERGGFLGGFSLRSSGSVNVNVTEGADAVCEFVNEYTPLPEPIPELQVHKVFHGVTNAEILAYLPDFEIVVNGPNGFREAFQMSSGALINGAFSIILEDLEVGNYTITEINSEIPGFDLTVAQTLPIILSISGDGVRQGKMAVIDNIYMPPQSPPPEPPPTSSPPQPPIPEPVFPPNVGLPPTGDFQKIMPYIVMLFIGIGCTGAAVIVACRRRYRKGRQLFK